MKNVIMVGYPKSGCTWLVRLVAELLECPVAGFWNSDIYEIGREGQDRISDFRCYKAHHQLHELEIEPNSKDHFIIYTVRDPRDVAISGANYFSFDKFVSRELMPKLFRKTPKVMGLYRRIVNRALLSERYKIDRMLDAILDGCEDVNHWCRIPWRIHYQPYWDHGVLFVRYEDLLTSPEKECSRILKYLGQSRDADFVKRAIEIQSFDSKKKRFMEKREQTQVAFLRVGQSGQWKQKFSEKQKAIFVERLSKELALFSYEI
jgi:hypothetical protein